MIDIKQFTALLYYYRSVMPHYAPDFGSENVLKFWYGVLGHYDINALRVAFNNAMVAYDKFPTLKQLVSDIENKMDSGNDSIYIASKIISAISRYGYCNPKEAKEFIGDIGWHVVNHVGGWQYICDTITNNNLTTYQAQLREIARNTIEKFNFGCLELNGNQEVQKIGSPLQKALDICKNGE